MSWEKLSYISPDSADRSDTCSIFQIYREKTNTILPTNCFNTLLYEVNMERKSLPRGGAIFIVSVHQGAR